MLVGAIRVIAIIAAIVTNIAIIAIVAKGVVLWWDTKIWKRQGVRLVSGWDFDRTATTENGRMAVGYDRPNDRMTV